MVVCDDLELIVTAYPFTTRFDELGFERVFALEAAATALSVREPIAFTLARDGARPGPASSGSCFDFLLKMVPLHQKTSILVVVCKRLQNSLATVRYR